ncbi:MAG: hypothetical protein ACXVA9_03085 [Bdellovibrionales bacterium]
MSHRLTAVLILMVLLIACEGSRNRDLENYGDITNRPGGAAINSSDQHLGGWGRKDCLMCHNVAYNVHRAAGSPIDADQLNQLIQNNGYSAYCLKCHGPNGVTP